MFACPGFRGDTGTPGPNILYRVGYEYGSHPSAGSLPAVNLACPTKWDGPETRWVSAWLTPLRQRGN